MRRMNFQQLRSVREATRQGYNLTEVAQALHTSQPGVSRQIREIEGELGVALFHREGKRLVGLTAPGERMLPIVERMLQSAEQLKRAGHDFARERSGRLTLAATHAQARYALPHAVRDFRLAHPDVQLHLRQGSPHRRGLPRGRPEARLHAGRDGRGRDQDLCRARPRRRDRRRAGATCSSPT
jgi:LysR family cys regulon transcriptional activator